VSEPAIGGLVLAAGAGRRFGGTKQLAEVDGRPLLEHPIRALLAVPAVWPVVVVLGHEARAIRSRVDFQDAGHVECAAWEDGMAASLRCGIRALGAVDGVLVLLGDQPFITPQVIAAVAGTDLRRWDAARAAYDGEPGHPVLLGPRLLARAGELDGDAGFRALLAGGRVRLLESADLCDPIDIDTREELARR
jgi:CTP:molybdopterin cytidylyltransferase MocA